MDKLSTALRVRRARIQVGQVEAAQSIGAGVSTWQKWEKGRGIEGITVRRAAKLAEFLDVKVDAVFGLILTELEAA